MSIPFFPLYNNLRSRIDEENVKQLTPAERSQFFQFIKEHEMRDNVVHETIYALIKHHSNIENHGITLDVPYDAEYRKNKSMKFSFTKIPPILQQVLWEFMIVKTNETLASSSE